MIPELNTIMFLAGKIFAILGTILYFIFSVVIVKQVASMSKNVYDKFNGVLKTISIFHLLFSAFLIVFALLFL